MGCGVDSSGSLGGGRSPDKSSSSGVIFSHLFDQQVTLLCVLDMCLRLLLKAYSSSTKFKLININNDIGGV